MNEMNDINLWEVRSKFNEQGELSHSETRYLLDSLNRAISIIGAIEVEMNCTYCCDKHIQIANDALLNWEKYRARWSLWYRPVSK